MFSCFSLLLLSAKIEEENQGVRNFLHILKRKFYYLNERQEKANSQPWPQRNLQKQFLEGLLKDFRKRGDDYLLYHPIEFLVIRERALVYEQQKKGNVGSAQVEHIYTELLPSVTPTDRAILQVLTNQGHQIDNLKEEMKLLQVRLEVASLATQDLAQAQRPLGVSCGTPYIPVTMNHP